MTCEKSSTLPIVFALKTDASIPEKIYEKMVECQKVKPFEKFIIYKKDKNYSLEFYQSKDKLSKNHRIDNILSKKFTAWESKQLYKESLLLGNNLFERLIKIYAAVRVGASASSKSIIEELVLTDPKVFYVNSILAKDKESKEVIIQKIYEIMNFLREKSPANYFSILATYISNFVPEKIKKDFDSEYDVDFSKQTIRELISSPNFGYRAPGAWIPQLITKVTKTEFKEYLEKVVVYNKRNLKKILWIFEFYMDKDEKIRKQIVEEVVGILNKDDFYSFELSNSLMNNQSLYSLLEKNKKTGSIPNFRVRRSHLLKFLNDNKYSRYAVFKLMGLGDLQNNYIDKI